MPSGRHSAREGADRVQSEAGEGAGAMARDAPGQHPSARCRGEPAAAIIAARATTGGKRPEEPCRLLAIRVGKGDRSTTPSDSWPRARRGAAGARSASARPESARIWAWVVAEAPIVDGTTAPQDVGRPNERIRR